MLGLMAILPRQINHELVGILIFAGIELSNVFLPASRWRLPSGVLRCLWLIRIQGMVTVIPRPLVAAYLRGARVGRRPAALLGLLSGGRRLKDLLATTDLDEIFLQPLRRALSV